ncbi:UDP-N-acetylmuramoyl-L-alanyl-D-glutamate--2,6-diaminopimelate ligase [Thalassiella azotivora]
MPTPSPDPKAVTAPSPPAPQAGAPRPRRVDGRPLSQVATRAGASLPADAAGGPVDPVVTGVTLDSRAVRPGDLYAALPGQRAHGAQFVDQAVAAGAVAVLTDPAGAELAGARAGTAGSATPPLLVVPDPRSVLGDVAALVYGEPAADLLMLGVTGTNGKTTTCFLLDAALRAAGRTTGLVGTVETRVGDERLPSVRTTPESPDVHALLALMRERGATACSMEVSSHALTLHRVDGVRYDVVGFTNLSQDHLDFHPDIEHYFAAKASLFTPGRAERGVVCVDDAWGRRLAATAAVPVVTVATTDPVDDDAPDALGHEPDWRVVGEHVEADARTTFTLRSRHGESLRVTCPLPGRFNVANTALALVMTIEAGVDPHAAVLGLGMAGGVPGRMERVSPPIAAGPHPLGVVDYAHTPDAVAAACAALRPATTGRLLVVLGAGGDRDPGKRRAMGAAAARWADVVVVTDDNPRSEDPAAIRAEVLAGARAHAATHPDQQDGQPDGHPGGRPVEVLEVADRREAVARAVRLAAATDTVLVAGKGHEQGQEVAGTVHPFDDRDELSGALATWEAPR